MKAHRHYIPSLLLFLLLVSAGCEYTSEPEDFSTLIGDLQQVENDELVDGYIRITDDAIIVAATSSDHPGIAVCSMFDIGDYDGIKDRITIIGDEGIEEASTIRRDGEHMIIDGDTYVRTPNFPTCNASISEIPIEKPHPENRQVGLYL